MKTFITNNFYSLLFLLLLFSCEKNPTTFTLNVSVFPQEGGEVIISPQSRIYQSGDIVTLMSKPNEGWLFDGWDGDVSGYSTQIELIIYADIEVKSVFKKSKFFIHSNGLTCMCPDTKSGDRGYINGIEYESVDNELLRIRSEQGGDLTKLCTSLVTDMSNIFNKSKLNQPIGNWDVSKVTNMSNMFSGSKFNQDISNWDVSNVTVMEGMFYGSQFNRRIGEWDVSNVTNMYSMFHNSKFNQDISNWDVGNVKNMRMMFSSSQFNQPIGSWDVGNVTDMGWMFSKSQFNHNIEDWDVSKVEDMNHMFSESQFNQPIGNWNVGNVTDMERMFLRSQFNQPIGKWDVSKVTNMHGMFYGSPFNQNISKWCVTAISSEGFSDSFPFTEENKPKWGTCPNN